MKERFAVVQLGARRHYAVPQAFAAAGVLTKLYTDVIDPGLAGLPQRFLPSSMRRLAGRIPAGIPRSSIKSFPGFACHFALKRRLHPRSMPAVCLSAGKRFCDLVVRDSLHGITSVYTFNTAALEVLQFAKRQGIRTVLEQTIAPYCVERELMRRERQSHPQWESSHHADCERSADLYEQREKAEWDLADTIICGSQYVAQEIADAGGPHHRCKVVSYSTGSWFTAPARHRAQKLRVLFCGVVSLRKGAPYVLAAAKRLHEVAQVRMVGSLDISPSAIRQISEHIQLVGPVPRSEVVNHYHWADVFVLPSICEGSAGVTYEALSCGLPIIATPNTGSVVIDGHDGFIVPIRDVDGIVNAVRRLHADRSLLEEMSSNAVGRAHEFTVGAYRDRLLSALTPETALLCH